MCQDWDARHVVVSRGGMIKDLLGLVINTQTSAGRSLAFIVN